MVWLCFIVPWAPRHHGCRFWQLEWHDIGWADLDVIWVVGQGLGGSPGFCMGALWEQASSAVQFWKTQL